MDFLRLHSTDVIERKSNGVLGSFVLVVAMLAMLSAASVRASSFELRPGVWEMLSVPAIPSDSSVGALFGDELAVADYYEPESETSTWVVWLYDAEINNYSLAGLNTPLAPGQGFWIIQRTDETVLLDYPENSPSPQGTAECNTVAGCYSVPLNNGVTAAEWTLVGSATDVVTPVSDISFKQGAANDECFTGCSLSTAAEFELTNDFVWIYDSSIEDYDERYVRDSIDLWKAFWIVTLPTAAGNDPELLMPLGGQQSTLNGRLTTPRGLPVETASVVSVPAGGGASMVSITDSNGEFSFDLPASTEFVFKIDADGYSSTVKPVQSASAGEEIDLEFVIVPRAYSTTVDVASGGSRGGPDGTAAYFPPNSFVDADGVAVSGEIDVSITPIDVSREAELAAFPGDFEGIQEAGGETPIITMGTVEFEFSQNGTPVSFSNANRDARIELPLFLTEYQDGTAVAAGQTIPLWSLNEETGIWQQEGEGTVAAKPASPHGFVLMANVSHFSWWNIDYPILALAYVRVGVFGSGGGSAVVSTSADVAGWNSSRRDSSTRIGDYTNVQPVPAGVPVCFSAEINYYAGSTATTASVCETFSVSNEPVDVNLQSPDIGDTLAVLPNIQPNASGIFAVDGYLGVPIDRIVVAPVTIESAVTFTADALPAGLSLETIDATHAEIVGEPTAVGTFDVTVSATNDVGDTSASSIQYVIGTDVPPPEFVGFPSGFFMTRDYIVTSFLAGSNSGGFATQWEILPTPGGPELPEGIHFDPVTAYLTHDFDVPFNYTPSGEPIWVGELRATNVSGSASKELRIYVEECFPDEFDGC